MRPTRCREKYAELFGDPTAAGNRARLARRAGWRVQAPTEVVGHNMGFDLPFLMRLGFTPGRVVDTVLASQVLHAGDVVAKHGLRDVAARHLGLTLDKEPQQADWAGTRTLAGRRRLGVTRYTEKLNTPIQVPVWTA